MSDYFNAQQNRLSKGVTARSNDVNQLRDEVGAGFDLLPTPDQLKQDLTNYGTAGGTADAITITMPYTPGSYVDGYAVLFKATATNTGAVTVNVDSLGVKSVVDQAGGALAAGDLVEDHIYEIRFNSDLDAFEMTGITTGDLSAAVTSAQAAQTAAETAQGLSEDARDAAVVAQGLAEAAQTGAELAQTGAEAAETGAGVAQVAAEAAQSAAEDAQGYAEEWATRAEDDLIPVAAGGDGVTDYSALHWAAKAQAAALNQFSYTTTATSKTLVNAEHVKVTAASQTMTLPATPSEGNRIRITVGNFTDTIVGRNGETITEQADDAVINLAYATIELVYTNSNWEVIR